MESSEYRKRKLEEYEMQLFGFHSRSVYATLQSIVYERIQSKVGKLCVTIEKTYKLDDEGLEELKVNKKELKRTYYKAAIPHLKNLENVVNKYIAVPKNVLLEEDKSQMKQYTDTEFANMKQKLDDLQQKARKVTVFNAALKSELQTQYEFAKHEETVTRMCNIIDQGFACPNAGKKMTEFVTELKKLSKRTNCSRQMPPRKLYNKFDNLHFEQVDFNIL